MKKTSIFFTLFLAITICNNTFAQDIIVLKNGDIIKTKVLEIGSTEIKYKKYTNIEGPIYSKLISEILAINYENGTKDTFDNNQNENTIEINEKRAKVSPDNSQLIYKYSTDIYDIIPDSNVKARKQFIKFAVGKESVLSNADIEVSFKMVYLGLYEIWLKNKSDKVITIDLERSFRVDSDGTSRNYYDPSESLSVSRGNSESGGISGGLLLRIGHGETKNSSSTKSYSKQSYIMIPPNGNVPLVEWKYVETKAATGWQIAEHDWVTMGEAFRQDSYPYNVQINKKGKVTIWVPTVNIMNENLKDKNNNVTDKTLLWGEIRNYNEINSPLKKNYSIKYYKNQDLNITYTIDFSLYAKYYIGTSADSKNRHLNSISFNPNNDIIGYYEE